jgi:diacylglycerol kinase family enzyme
VDGTGRTTHALLIALANGPEYGSGARVAPHAQLDDGRLDLVVVEDRPALARLAAGGRIFTSTLASAPGVWTATLTRLAITAEAPLAFHVDGEVVQGGVRLTARVYPAALRIRHPR